MHRLQCIIHDAFIRRENVLPNIDACGILPPSQVVLNIFSLSGFTVFETKFALLEKLIDAFDSEHAPAYLMFGDSVALRVAEDDTCTETLEQLVAAELDGEGVCCISHSAFHSQVFCLFSNALARLRHQPRSVILPINLRSFSLSWDLHPDYQFLWETATLDDFARGVEASRPPIESTPIAKAVFQAIPLTLPSGEIRPIGEFMEVIASRVGKSSGDGWNMRMRDIFTFHYLYNLYPAHRKLRYFGSTVKTLLRRGIGVGLYITPVNHRAGKLYVGELFPKYVTANIAIIERYLRTFGVEVIDVSDLKQGLNPSGRKPKGPAMLNLALECNDHDFFTPHNSTEHLRGAARKILAGNIAMLAKAVVADGEH